MPGTGTKATFLIIPPPSVHAWDRLVCPQSPAGVRKNVFPHRASLGRAGTFAMLSRSTTDVVCLSVQIFFAFFY